MKAMILAAGLGTRLLPYTKHTPKPLFTISGKPILKHVMDQLQHAGCEEIIINTHHLHHKIEEYIASKAHAIPIHLIHEPEILGTGGAVRNAAAFFNDTPFILFNSDILTDIDLKEIYNFHLKHSHPVTMVMHDYAEFNNVSIDSDAYVTKIHSGTAEGRLAFTGIHVIDPAILAVIPSGQYYNILDAYTQIISDGQRIKAYIVKGHYWKDIGKIQSYKQACFDIMVPEAFQQAYPDVQRSEIAREYIQGDGSDRSWSRFSTSGKSLLAVDHGIRQSEETVEVDAFIHIGDHLHKNNLPVPEIFLHDAFSGLVFLEDLGSTHLQDIISKLTSDKEITSHYLKVIEHIGNFSVSGADGFDTSWTYQTTHYDKDLILEKECNYFVEAFLQNYLGMDVTFDDLKEEFNLLADKALDQAVLGLMHRDMQSRNIMVKEGNYYFIDFQGARLGPVQYDLASLIIDPYVALPFSLQSQLINFSVETLFKKTGVKKKNFRQCLNYSLITRNLQILGAFGFLSKVKSKKYFEEYIPTAIKTLKQNLSTFNNANFSVLKSITDKL